MSNSLDPDQARRFVGPDLGPNCLPRLSADDTSRQRVNGERICTTRSIGNLPPGGLPRNSVARITDLICVEGP